MSILVKKKHYEFDMALSSQINNMLTSRKGEGPFRIAQGPYLAPNQIKVLVIPLANSQNYQEVE